MATAFKQVADNALSSTATDLSSVGVTSIVAASGEGSRFPTPGNGWYLTIWTGNSPTADPNMEKVLVSARSGDTITCDPTVETHAAPVNIGLLIEAQNVIDLQDAVNDLENAPPVSGSEITDAANASVDVTYDPVWGTGVIRVKDNVNPDGSPVSFYAPSTLGFYSHTLEDGSGPSLPSFYLDQSNIVFNLETQADEFWFNAGPIQLQLSFANLDNGAQVQFFNGGGGTIARAVDSYGGTGVSTMITEVGHPFTDEVVRFNGTNWVLAEADSLANAGASGFAFNWGADIFMLVSSGFCEWFSGLTPGATYYLSPTTPGALTTTMPVGAGEVVKPMLLALSATSGLVLDVPGVEVGAGGASVWGDITGTLSDQTDLQSALNLKAPLASPAFTGTPTGITKAHVGLSNVDNTSDASKPVSTATQTALDLKVDETITVNGHALSSNVTVTKSDVSLGNVDNTSDANKPVSTAQQTALDLKVDETITVNGQALSSNVTITKSDVGLGSVDNTSDTSKPVSTAQQTALDSKQDTLVSGTNIKTVNGTSIVGSGNVVISGATAYGTIQALASGLATY